jgi:hypothetical protein
VQRISIQEERVEREKGKSAGICNRRLEKNCLISVQKNPIKIIFLDSFDAKKSRLSLENTRVN